MSSPGIDKIDSDRFWSHINRKGVDDCWEWTGHINWAGYGRFRCAISGKTGKHTASRVAFVLHFGTIPPGLCVLHQCNNAACCNPSHLYIGTHRQNMLDAKAAGVHKGENHPSHRLTEDQVLEIRERYAAGGVMMQTIAASFGVSLQHVSCIINGKRWAHLMKEAE